MLRLLLLLICGSSLLAADHSETQELVLHCRGAVSLAKVLAGDPFMPSQWSLGQVTTTDAGVEDYLLPSDLPGERRIRRVQVSANPLSEKSTQDTKRELQFLAKDDPYVKALVVSTGSGVLWRIVRLKKWRWYDMPGLLVFRLAADAKDEKAFEAPCKLPAPWAAFFKEAAALRQQQPDGFSPTLGEPELTRMRNEATTTPNPLWRLCLTSRLLELKQLRPEDIQRLLETSAGKPLELGALLVLLLKDTTSHEEEIMQEVRTHGRTPGTAEGLALGCLMAIYDKPKHVEKAFQSLDLEKQLKAKVDTTLEDKIKMIETAFPGDEVFEFRVAHQLKLRLTGADEELRQKVEAILYFMLEP